jgi:DNA-binding NarL/FixJ family response regulator
MGVMGFGQASRIRTEPEIKIRLKLPPLHDGTATGLSLSRVLSSASDMPCSPNHAISFWRNNASSRSRADNMAIRILIADDQTIVRQGLSMLLQMDSDLEVVGEALDGAEAVCLARELRPDLVLMDLLMPDMDGIAATSIIRREVPETEVLVLTSLQDARAVVESVRAGVIGYLPKDIDAKTLRRAIRAAAAGQIQLSAEAELHLLREVRGPGHVQPLTMRETDVLRLMVAGMANKEIARDLMIGETTVKSHVRHILGKFGVESRTQAALHAIRMGSVAE